MKSLRAAGEALARGGVGVLPTDTIYGLVGSALRPGTVARIYRLRRRNPAKPVIVLISSPEEVRRFGVEPSKKEQAVMAAAWPGKTSIILPCRSRALYYLHRGTGTLAFRVPRPKWLREFLRSAGPLAAPSANPEGMPPALTVREAKKYFGRRAGFYVDRGRLAGKPSTLISIKNGRASVVRAGAGRGIGRGAAARKATGRRTA